MVLTPVPPEREGLQKLAQSYLAHRAHDLVTGFPAGKKLGEEEGRTGRGGGERAPKNAVGGGTYDRKKIEGKT